MYLYLVDYDDDDEMKTTNYFKEALSNWAKGGWPAAIRFIYIYATERMTQHLTLADGQDRTGRQTAHCQLTL